MLKQQQMEALELSEAEVVLCDHALALKQQHFASGSVRRRSLRDREHDVDADGIYTMITDAIPGQTVPPIDRTWLALSPFQDLSGTRVEQMAVTTDKDVKGLLRRRARLLDLIVRLSLTSKYDWKTTFDVAAVSSGGRDSGLHRRPFAWKNVLQKLACSTWGEPSTARCLVVLRWPQPRFLIEYHHVLAPDNFGELLEYFLMGLIVDDPTDYKDIGQVRDLLAEPEKKTAVASPRCVIELALALGCDRITTPLLYQIIEALERFAVAQDKILQSDGAKNSGVLGGHANVEFRVTTLLFTGQCKLVSNALQQLDELINQSDNLHIDTISLGKLREVEDPSLQQCLTGLTTKAALRRLSCTNDGKSFAVLGSAVRSKNTIQELHVCDSATEMHTLAAWLAFGFFHRDSASAVRSLSLEVQGKSGLDAIEKEDAVCSPQWVETFQRVLTSVTSSEDLAPIDLVTGTLGGGGKRRQDPPGKLEKVAMPNDKRVFVAVKQNTKVRRQPHPRSEVVACLAADTVAPPCFQVVRHVATGWLAIVVPGAGVGWIPAKAVTAEHMIATAIGEPPFGINTQLKSFAWIGRSRLLREALEVQHANGLVALLAIIGEPLEALHLPDTEFDDDHLEPILRYCPNLRELNLAGNYIGDLSPLVQAYASNTCRITSLTITGRQIASDEVVRQCGAILSSGAPLERLALRISPIHPDIEQTNLLEELCSDLQRAIRSSTTLEYIRVHCTYADKPQVQKWLALPQPLDEKTQVDEPYFVSQPLSMRCKLALVSAVDHAAATQQQSALGKLDASVLQWIIEFARPTQCRQVEIAADLPILTLV